MLFVGRPGGFRHAEGVLGRRAGLVADDDLAFAASTALVVIIIAGVFLATVPKAIVITGIIVASVVIPCISIIITGIIIAGAVVTSIVVATVVIVIIPGIVVIAAGISVVAAAVIAVAISELACGIAGRGAVASAALIAREGIGDARTAEDEEHNKQDSEKRMQSRPIPDFHTFISCHLHIPPNNECCYY